MLSENDRLARRPFGLVQGQKATLYTLTNDSGMEIDVTDYGATVVAVRLPDACGPMAGRDVVLGYDSPEGYRMGACCLGATIGRNANRTSGARILTETGEIILEKNEHGKNNLHSSDVNGYHKRMWRMIDAEEDYLALRLDSPEGDQGFPGAAIITAEFAIKGGNSLSITYRAKADADTVFNLTNHSYFNLSGDLTTSIEHESLQVFSDAYLAVNEESLPLRALEPVNGTLFDLRQETKIGDRVNPIDPYYQNGKRTGESDSLTGDKRQLVLGRGYDHCFILDKSAPMLTDMGIGQMNPDYEVDRGLRLAAILTDQDSGLRMNTYTDSPALQVYTGNWIGGESGKDGLIYNSRSGVALETQFVPDAFHVNGVAKPYYKAGDWFCQTTIYQFEKVN